MRRASLFEPICIFFIIGAVVYNVQYAMSPDYKSRVGLPQIGVTASNESRGAFINRTVVTSQYTILNTLKGMNPNE